MTVRVYRTNFGTWLWPTVRFHFTSWIFFSIWQHYLDMIGCFVFYAVSTIFQPCNGGSWHEKMVHIMYVYTKRKMDYDIFWTKNIPATDEENGLDRYWPMENSFESFFPVKLEAFTHALELLQLGGSAISLQKDKVMLQTAFTLAPARQLWFTALYVHFLLPKEKNF